jgi:restriction endonuclease Mrr
MDIDDFLAKQTETANLLRHYRDLERTERVFSELNYLSKINILELNQPSLVLEATRPINEILQYETSFYEQLRDIVGIGQIEHLQKTLDEQGRIYQRLFDQLNWRYVVDFDDLDSNDLEENIHDKIDPEVSSNLIAIDDFPIHVLKEIMRDPSHIRNISPRDFEYLTAYIVEKLGFHDVVVTPPSGDGGRDVIATHTVGNIRTVYSFECKHYKESNVVGVDAVRGLLGSVVSGPTQASVGVLVTTSTFSKGAKKMFLADARIDGKDYQEILNWIDTIRKALE